MSKEIRQLRARATGERVTAVSSLIKALSKVERIYLSTDIDEEKTAYEKGIDKEYVFSHSKSYSGEFRWLIDCNLLDYGIDDTSGELLRDVFEDGREIRLDLDWSPPSTKVTMRGSFFGDAGHFEYLGDGFKAELEIIGVPASHSLSLYQELVIEGFCMEQVNRRLALFCYFSAAECIIIDLIASYREKIAPELHYPLERLGVIDKVKMLGRDTAPGGDLNKLEVWGEMLGTLGGVAQIRNQIAHPRESYIVTVADLDQAFFSLLLLHAVLVEKKTKAKEINKLYFP